VFFIKKTTNSVLFPKKNALSKSMEMHLIKNTTVSTRAFFSASENVLCCN